MSFCLCVHISTLYKDSSHIGLGTSLTTTFNLVMSIKTLSPNKVTSEDTSRTTACLFCGGDSIQPTTFNQLDLVEYNLPDTELGAGSLGLK